MDRYEMDRKTKMDEAAAKRSAEVRRLVGAGVVALLVLVAVIFAGTAGWKSLTVWSREQDGRAQIAEARYSKQVQIEEAKANLEAERLNAQAEVERAKGAAEAIEIEGGNLTENYIRYLWVRNLEKYGGELIYVPTEGGIPIMEAGRTSGGER